MSKSRLVRYALFLQAVTKHIASGKSLLTKEEIEGRLEICRPCDYFTGTNCSKCTCCTGPRRTLFNKLAHPEEECPEGKWSKFVADPIDQEHQTKHDY